MNMAQFDADDIDDLGFSDRGTRTGRKGRKKYAFAVLVAISFSALLVFFSQTASQEIDASRQDTEPFPEPINTGSSGCGDGLCSISESCGSCLVDCGCRPLACNMDTAKCEAADITALIESSYSTRDYTVYYFSEYRGKKYYTVGVMGRVETISEDGAKTADI